MTGSSKWAKFMGLALLMALSVSGCATRGATPSPAERPIVHGATTPTAAVKGFIDAVRDGNVKQALACWEFPKKGIRGYVQPHRGEGPYKIQVIRQARKRHLEGIFWHSRPSRLFGVWFAKRLLSLRPTSDLRWRFRIIMLYAPLRNHGATSLRAAEWADVRATAGKPRGQDEAEVEYSVHKNGGRWRVVSATPLFD